MRLTKIMTEFVFLTAFLLLTCGCGGPGQGKAPEQNAGENGDKAVSSELPPAAPTAAEAGDGAADKAEPSAESSGGAERGVQSRTPADGGEAKAAEPPLLSENGTELNEKAESDKGVDNMTLSARGDAPWNLKAERISYDDAAKRARASSIIWNLLDKEGRSVLEVRGDAAVINVATQGVAFEGPVRAAGSKGESIVCNKLIWDSAAKKLRGSKGVRVVRDGTVMTGRELTASPDFKQVEVSGNVRISFVPGEDGGKGGK
ncbi:LPS export ABC transporter periplasmic protein LptC [bacterium]|nr:LPS export ABC transporter periplasmic protein LptC [bacterium]